MEYPMDHILNHMVNASVVGAQIGNMIRRNAMEQEVIARQKQREDREAQLQDLDVRQKLMAAGRPVNGNAVDESMPLPPNFVSGPGMPTSVDYTRPVDKKRLLSYKTASGENLQVEAYTPEEQINRSIARAQLMQTGMQPLERMRALAEADTQSEVRKKQAVPLPGKIGEAFGLGPDFTALPSEIPHFAGPAASYLGEQDRTRGITARTLAIQDELNARNEENNQNRLDVQELRGNTATDVAKTRANAPSRAAGALPGREDRLATQAAAQAQKNHDAALAKFNLLDSEEKAGGRYGKSGFLVPFSDPLDAARHKADWSAARSSLNFYKATLSAVKSRTGAKAATAPPPTAASVLDRYGVQQD